MKNSRVIRMIADHPMAITLEKLQQIEAFLEYRIAGGPPVVYEAAAGRRAGGVDQRGSVAVIPIFGSIANRMSMLEESSGGVSCDQIKTGLRQALADSQTRSIILHFDSPGGSVYGIEELATEIFQASNSKRIIGVCDALCASAAYWLASACTEIVCTPSGEVGSIGVIAMHVDESAALEQEGLKVSYITAGDHKAEGNSTEPLSDGARAFTQQRVNEYYGSFLSAVARGRKTSAATVKANFGQGRVYGAEQAFRVGMIDGIKTLDQAIGREASMKRGPVGRTAAAAPLRAPELTSALAELAEWERQAKLLKEELR